MNALFESSLSQYPLLARGKVRDIYQVDDHHLLLITTDRLSAYDVIMPKPIPHKGEILNRIATFWFNKTEHIIANHLSDLPMDLLFNDAQKATIGDRALLVKKLTPLPIEAVVRQYLIGSGWKDYQQNGSVCGITLPEGLQQAEKLPQAIFTPATKADVGDHDINISFDQVVSLIGTKLAEQVRDVSLALFHFASKYAYKRGIIIADTKFEFGIDDHQNLYLIDEALTPDSSRFWDVKDYQVGISPPSFDKQFLRDYLENSDWDKTAPGPDIPEDIIEKTAEKYAQAEKRLTT